MRAKASNPPALVRQAVPGYRLPQQALENYLQGKYGKQDFAIEVRRASIRPYPIFTNIACS